MESNVRNVDLLRSVGKEISVIAEGASFNTMCVSRIVVEANIGQIMSA
jgi:hypothetical protein